MNKQIEKLWDRAATASAALPSGQHTSWETQVYFIETLVKLVATECADISDDSFHNGSAGFLAIKNHFGVK